MKINKEDLEQMVMDTIAVVYHLTETKRTAIKPDEYDDYDFADTNTYLIVCGQSEYIIENRQLTRTYTGRYHPLYNSEKK